MKKTVYEAYLDNQTKLKAREQKRLDSRKRPGLSAHEQKSFESQFDSDTSAGADRGSMMYGHHIGDGAKWYRMNGQP